MIKLIFCEEERVGRKSKPYSKIMIGRKLRIRLAPFKKLVNEKVKRKPQRMNKVSLEWLLADKPPRLNNLQLV